MIQLKVYKTERVITGTTADADALFLDLYETEPIKLTLSIEDITNADATSVFSKTFRVPATRHNNDFFENVYEIDGIDFDVTVKNPAQILVDGAEFREGHIRLQKIYRNHDLDRVDYELLFLGETRDFSSAVGENSLCQMTMTDFSWLDLPVAYTNAADFTGSATYTEITNSWTAFPESASTTAGHADGDILYPLIDHGNEYSETTGNIVSGFGTISLGETTSFTDNANALAGSRMKPMIRAKRVWDQIFQDAGYTYQSTFLDSDRFKQMYASAFGNSERASVDQAQVTTGLFEVFGSGATGNNGFDRLCYFPNIVQNSPDFTIGTPDTGSGGGSSFLAQDSADPSGAYYQFDAGARVGATAYEPSDPNGYENINARVRLLCIPASGASTQVLAVGNWESQNLWSFFNYDSRNGGYQPQVNDIFKVDIQSQNPFDTSQVGIVYWHCDSAPGSYYMPRDLDCEYLQIDYIKDIITMFRLVMQPDNTRPNHFIIEPWSTFIGSGTTYDWSDKLVQDKDMVLEPLFNTQSAQIEYTFAEDEDLINKFHQDNNKHAYGWLRFDSQNELLKGTRKVEVKGIAPTPIDQIHQGGTGVHVFPQFILPSIVEISGENFQRLPIKPKTRFLFYSGLQDITNASYEWYLIDGNTPSAVQNKWPLVSPYETFPIINTVPTLNLNFSNDTRYYIDPDPNYYDNNTPPAVIQPGYFDQGQTLFDSYWSRYVSSLYDKFSRRLTAKFILNNVDLQYLTFDDVIFINGKYYRPEKIINAQVGAETEVTCQLITLNDQRPIWLDEPLNGFSVAVSNTNCIGEQGNIQITTEGTPAFTWELSTSGAQGNVNPTGTAPFTFTITAPVGVDTLTVTDALGRIAIVQVDVPASTSIPVTGFPTIVNPTICDGSPAACNGSLEPTGGGGSGAPYTVTYSDGYTATLPDIRTNLCEGTYQYTVEDSSGCESDLYTATLLCATPSFVYQVAEHINNCTQNSFISYIVNSSVALTVGQTLTLNERAGCYAVIGTSTATPLYTVLSLYSDCASCSSGTPTSWKVQSCLQPVQQNPLDNSTRWISTTTPFTVNPGDIVKDTTGPIDIYGPCYTVVSQDFTQAPNTDFSEVYDDCATCAGPGTFGYYAFACDGSSFPPTNFQSATVLSVGGVYKIETGTYAGICVQIIKTNVTPSGEYLLPFEYEDCNDCQGITPPPIQVCHTLTNTGLSTATGTYTYNGSTVGWTVTIGGNPIAICAEVGSIVTTTGNVTVAVSASPCTSPKQCTLPPPPPLTYVIQECLPPYLNWTMETQGSIFQLGDVIQFKAGVPGTGATYCGTIININSGTPDATLVNTFSSYSCGDTIHCRQ